MKEPSERKTVLDLEEIVGRALSECVEAKMISAEGESLLYVETEKVAKHIALTVIGELHELEVLRKIGPVIRAVNGILKDFEFFDEVERNYQKLMATRVGQQEGGQDNG